jgi:murein DD-endopeptidase MepM/ murein hydrolase activator NlpD
VPKPAQGKGRQRNPLQRIGIHFLLLGAGAAAMAVAIVLSDDDEPISPQQPAEPLLDQAELPPTLPDSQRERETYARSPLIPGTPTDEASGSAQTTPIPGDRTRTAVEEIEPLFVNHIVEEGETVSQLAEEFGIMQQTILDNNQEIVDPAALGIGQQLTIPTVDGVLHTVQLGQTLDQIATVFEADAQEIINFKGNELLTAEDVIAGKIILVVGGTFPDPVEFQPIPGDGFPLVVPETGFLAGFPPAVNNETGFILPYWPCAAPSPVQDFGYARGRLHAGVDMPSFCARSSNVYAAQSGTVVTAGWSGGYGNLVVIDHGFGFTTHYGHLSQIQVTVGQYVYRGQVIGISGNTGYSFGEHLHFEVRIHGHPTDPKPYLPWPWPY